MSLDSISVKNHDMYKIAMSRIGALKGCIERLSGSVSHALLGSRESLERRTTIDFAFRGCRDAFLEVVSTYLHLLKERSNENNTKIDDLKNVVVEAIREVRGSFGRASCEHISPPYSRESLRTPSYASVVRFSSPRAWKEGGSWSKIPKTTNFLIVPEDDSVSATENLRNIKETAQNALRTSRMSLKVQRLSVRGRGICIAAVDPDLEALSKLPELKRAELKVQRQEKLNPRIVVYGVPAGLTKENICNKIVKLNLQNGEKLIKPIYLFPTKKNWNYTSFVFEVSPETRKALFK